MATIVLGTPSRRVPEIDNFFYLGLNIGEVAIIALPLALIVITGEIDLSVAVDARAGGHDAGPAASHGLIIWLAMVVALALRRRARRASTACS